MQEPGHVLTDNEYKQANVLFVVLFIGNDSGAWHPQLMYCTGAIVAATPPPHFSTFPSLFPSHLTAVSCAPSRPWHLFLILSFLLPLSSASHVFSYCADSSKLAAAAAVVVGRHKTRRARRRMWQDNVVISRRITILVAIMCWWDAVIVVKRSPSVL